MTKQPRATADWNRAVLAAVSLLRQLPPDYRSAAASRELFRSFQAEHEKVRCELLAARRPGTTQADFDILLSAEDGTLALAWSIDDGLPWMVQHAEHSSANHVLTVNGRHLSIQSALLVLNTSLKKNPGLMDQLVSSLLISEAIDAAPPWVTEGETARAVNEFRASNGLHLASATRRWLDETGLTMEALKEMAAYSVRLRKFSQNRFGAEARRRFDAQPREFDRVTAVRVGTSSLASARTIVRATRSADLWSAVARRPPSPTLLQAELLTRSAFELPAEVAQARVGAVVGPVKAGVQHEVWQVLHRTATRFDAGTRKAIQDWLLKQWLDQRRAEARVQWHWI